MDQWEITGTLYVDRTSLFQTFIAVTELLWRRLMVTRIFLSYDPHLQIEIFHTCFQLKLEISSPSNLSYLYNTPQHVTCEIQMRIRIRIRIPPSYNNIWYWEIENKREREKM